MASPCNYSMWLGCVSYSLIFSCHTWHSSRFHQVSVRVDCYHWFVNVGGLCSFCRSSYELLFYMSCLKPASWSVSALLLQMRLFNSRRSAQYVLSPQCDCAVDWPRPSWRCVRFPPRDSERVSDRDKLSRSIHLTPVVSMLFRPSPAQSSLSGPISACLLEISP